MQSVIINPAASAQLKVFISYAWGDGEKTAAALLSICLTLGFDVWIDRNKLRGGDVLVQELRDAIECQDVILAVITPDSVASPMCRSEREYAATKFKVIIPVLLDRSAEIPVGMSPQLWRLYPDDLASLIADLNSCALAVTPDQMGPGLNRLTADEFNKWRTASRRFAIQEATSGLLRLISEIDELARVLRTLPFGNKVGSGMTSDVRALMFTHALFVKHARHKRIIEDDILVMLRRHHLKDDYVDGRVAKLVLESVLAPVRTIELHKRFAERPDIVFGNSGLRVLYSILSMNAPDLVELPTFQHRGLDAAVNALSLIENDGEIMSAAMLKVLLTSRDANTKTVIAHLGRRFKPLGERVGSQWDSVIQKAIKTTEGTEQELLDVEHNVNYMAAMHGIRAGIDNIMSIESDKRRLEAIERYNRNISGKNFTQLLHMLNRKGQNPDKDEEWAKPWAARLYKILKPL